MTHYSLVISNNTSDVRGLGVRWTLVLSHNHVNIAFTMSSVTRKHNINYGIWNITITFEAREAYLIWYNFYQISNLCILNGLTNYEN